MKPIAKVRIQFSGCKLRIMCSLTVVVCFSCTDCYFEFGEVPKWLKETPLLRRLDCVNGSEGSNPSLSVRLIFIRPVGQVVKTPPFHGGNRGSSPLRVTIILEA